MKRAATCWMIVAAAAFCTLRGSHGGKAGEHADKPAVRLFGEISGHVVLAGNAGMPAAL